jgi:hypothetical protein
MPWFRQPRKSAAPVRLDAQTVRAVIGDLLGRRHFFVGQGIALEWQGPVGEEVPWEIFRGRLLDPAHTRLRQAFEAWHIFRIEDGQRSAEPLLSLKLDLPGRQVHVVRALLCHAWEGYDAGGNVYLSRETRRWVRELVGTVYLDQLPGMEELRDELNCRLFQAVVGTSRLPLTSVEAPLPDFSLGRLGYSYQPAPTDAGPLRSWDGLIGRSLHAGLAWTEKAKLLETVLRSVDRSAVGEAADAFAWRWSELGHAPPELLALLRTLFNDVALSPYTGFVVTTLAFVEAVVRGGHLMCDDQVDFIGSLMRQLARHLTAYDLHTFHHRGANYPDALLLDAALKEYLRLAEGEPALFLAPAGNGGRERLRRRALRQGWLLRRFYEGLPVPAVPVSPGENARILPAPHVRVPEEEIAVPAKRSKRLFDGDPLEPYFGTHGHDILTEALRDLEHPTEIRELGTALFIDRPLGVFKARGEPDQTLLLSYVAFSRSLARARLEYLAHDLGLVPRPELDKYRQALDALEVSGVALEAIGGNSRPDGVSLADARTAAADFVMERTTNRSVAEFLDQFDFGPVAAELGVEDLLAGGLRLIVRGTGHVPERGTLVLYDQRLEPCLELEVDGTAGYESRAGQEFPAAGLRIVRRWPQSRADATPRGQVVRPRR